MKKLICLTSCLRSDKCYSLSSHLMLLIRCLLDHGGFQIEILSYDETSPLTDRQVLENLDCPDLYERITLHSLNSLAPETWASRLEEADILLCQHYAFAEILQAVKKRKPGMKIVSWIHSIVQEEYLSGAILYKNDAYPLIRQQNLQVSLSDICVFDSRYDYDLGRLDFTNLNRARVIYLVTEMDKYQATWQEANREFFRNGSLRLEDVEILYIGRWDYRKGLDSLISCCFRMFMEHGVKTVLLSNRGKEVVFSDETAERQYRALVSAGGLRFERWKLGKKQYASYLCSRRWVAVMPSYYDPFNMAAYDCAVLGMPVVISNRCGVSEILQEDKGLAICNPYDREVLYERVYTMCRASLGPLPKHAIRYGYSDFQKNILELFNDLAP